MTHAVFITGTDTGIGKTRVAATLLAALNANGQRNDDAQLLIAHSAGTPDYALVNPYALPQPIAPHLAAADAGVEIRLGPIHGAYAALSTNADFVVVEGVGGWAVPLSPSLMQADLVQALDVPVILVVGLRLGCLNHALLSARAIAVDGCRLIGWIGNRIDPAMARADDNIAVLRERLPAPCLDVLEHAADARMPLPASALRDAASYLARMSAGALTGSA
jgi:dethiobiotin synthetase